MRCSTKVFSAATVAQPTTTAASPPAIQAGTIQVPTRVTARQRSPNSFAMPHSTSATPAARAKVPPYTHQNDDGS